MLFTIERLDSKGRIWKSGGVRFYDPEVYDLRDARLFERVPSKIVTIAEVKVRAVSTLDAARIAWRRASLVLNNTAFALSIDKTTGGFSVRRDPYIHVIRVERNSSLAGAMLTRTDRPIVQSVEMVESWVTPKFDRLITRIEQGAEPSELEDRFLCAIHWYNKGRWKEDAAETFLYYWIGIETLFGGVGQQALFDQMSELLITWRNAYDFGNYGLRRFWDDLVKKLKTDSSLASKLDSIRALKNWSRDRRVLADHRRVELVIKLAPDNTEVRSYAERYLEYLSPFVANRMHFEREVTLLRSEFRFKLLLLKGLRNEIAHFGVHEHPALDLYANELQGIFEDLLVRVGNGIIDEVPRHTTMDSLIKELNEWWVK